MGEASGPSTAGATDAAGVARGLIAGIFCDQDTRPAGWEDVDVVRLEPHLRNLLFIDGTVTRALEVQALSPVSVSVIEECRCPTGTAGRWLELDADAPATRRRVAIRVAAYPGPAVYAESVIVHDRLPSRFARLLGASPQGIGEALRAGHLESRRELLWHGVGRLAAWVGEADASTPALARAYRVRTAERPAMLIVEHFVVEAVDGSYRLRTR